VQKQDSGEPTNHNKDVHQEEDQVTGPHQQQQKQQQEGNKEPGTQQAHPKQQQQQLSARLGRLGGLLLLLAAVQRATAAFTWWAVHGHSTSTQEQDSGQANSAASRVSTHAEELTRDLQQMKQQYFCMAAALAGAGGAAGSSGSTASMLPRYTAVCGYPGCTNMSGPSEVALVTNRGGVVCGGCGVVRYCCVECAAKGWPAHRKECRRLRAANRAHQARKAAAPVAAQE
jgi:hypothetical protein